MAGVVVTVDPTNSSKKGELTLVVMVPLRAFRDRCNRIFIITLGWLVELKNCPPE